MAAPRNRYAAVIQSGDVYHTGRIITFRSRSDEVAERLREALRDIDLEPGTGVVVLRYTQIRELEIVDTKPAGWHYEFKEG